MKVKVGDKWYSSREQPIMVELTEDDKENIKNMLPTCTKYAQYEESQFLNVEDVYRWMN